MPSRFLRPFLAWLPALVVGVLPCARAADEGNEEGDFAVQITTEYPQPMLAAATETYRPVRLSSDADRTEALLSAVRRAQTDVAFAEMPLRECLSSIAKTASIPVGLDTRAIDDAGLDPEMPVTLRASGRPLASVLRSMLEPLGLTFVARHGQLLVTTLERAESPSSLERFLYPLFPGTDPEEVRVLIEATIAPETWDSVGGTSTIMTLPASSGSGLVVSQTEENHERIAALLGGLDAAIWNPAPENGARKDATDAKNAAEADGARAPRLVRCHPVSDPAARDELVQTLVDLCNDALPRGNDPDATVRIVGESLVVQSKSRAFHVMAASIITAINGIESVLIEEEAEEAADPPPVVQATSARLAR